MMGSEKLSTIREELCKKLGKSPEELDEWMRHQFEKKPRRKRESVEAVTKKLRRLLAELEAAGKDGSKTRRRVAK